VLITNKLEDINDCGIVISIWGDIHPTMGGMEAQEGGRASQKIGNIWGFIPQKIKKIIIIIFENVLNLGGGSIQ